MEAGVGSQIHELDTEELIREIARRREQAEADAVDPEVVAMIREITRRREQAEADDEPGHDGRLEYVQPPDDGGRVSWGQQKLLSQDRRAKRWHRSSKEYAVTLTTSLHYIEQARIDEGRR